ncbi:hypothetical protein L6452_08511 [Arctium lappa]|uniref:Uncharacterized protein n=1 Tax=Arctium lappa TaxID=4217 RepID=A0ACB9DHW8_ARCLA|nr:hypothetical protein L6452_08511 [Arctium lappa]
MSMYGCSLGFDGTDWDVAKARMMARVIRVKAGWQLSVSRGEREWSSVKQRSGQRQGVQVVEERPETSISGPPGAVAVVATTPAAFVFAVAVEVMAVAAFPVMAVVALAVPVDVAEMAVVVFAVAVAVEVEEMAAVAFVVVAVIVEMAAVKVVKIAWVAGSGEKGSA